MENESEGVLSTPETRTRDAEIARHLERERIRDLAEIVLAAYLLDDSIKTLRLVSGVGHRGGGREWRELEKRNTPAAIFWQLNGGRDAAESLLDRVRRNRPELLAQLGLQ